MIKQYIKHAFRLIKEAPVLSTIMILGTALAVCMLMIKFMVHSVETGSVYPEVNRDRTLYISYIKSIYKDPEGKNGGESNGGIARFFVEEILKPIESAEVVASYLFRQDGTPFSAPGSKNNAQGVTRGTDAQFWDVFRFKFISGSPFTQEDFDSRLAKAVIDEDMARKVFQTTDVVGREILINFSPYTIVGVVENAFELAQDAYANAWYPYSVEDFPETTEPSGNVMVAVMAKSKADFPEIRAEVEKRIEQFNADKNRTHRVSLMEQPDDFWVHFNRSASNIPPDMKEVNRTNIVSILIFLLIPAINLAAMTSSRMQKRYAELGLRRSFGATKGGLLNQVLSESFIQSLLGGILGFVLAVIFVYLSSNTLFQGNYYTYSDGVALPVWNIISVQAFLMVLLCCFVINFISTFIPAWRATKKPIVESLSLKK